MKTHSEKENSRLLDAYKLDANGFSTVFNITNAENILKKFNDYGSFIKNHLLFIKPKKIIKNISNNTAVIKSTMHHPELNKIFQNAHVAACCELFRDWSIPVQSLDADSLLEIINSSMNICLTTEQKWNEISFRVHNSDAIRTSQILKNLGLLNIEDKKNRQLSFAAGHGNRDIDGFHSSPRIKRHNVMGSTSKDTLLKFSRKVNKPEYAVLIDNDPVYSQQYNLLNHEQSNWIIALNKDANEAMSELPEILKKTGRDPINLILGLRIDHRMIPDVKLFFNRILSVMDDSADLVISIGAGHTLEEFIGRKNKIQEIFDYLTKQRQSPLRIQLHGGNTATEQRQSPSFGLLHYTTYEILYCKLKKNKLSKSTQI